MKRKTRFISKKSDIKNVTSKPVEIKKSEEVSLKDVLEYLEYLYNK